MGSLLDELATATKSNDEASIKKHLRAIITQGSAFNLYALAPVEALFRLKSRDVLLLTAEALAELAKSDGNRALLSDEQVVAFLLNLLSTCDGVMDVQVCRALGNLCFENDAARELIGKEGLQKVLCTLKNKTDLKLQTVACGFLLNLIMGNDELQQAALESNVLGVTEELLKIHVTNLKAYEDACTHLLLTLNILTDYLVDQWLSHELCTALLEILKVSQNSEISVICLEVLHGQLENSDIQLLLARQGLCELVYELVEKYRDRVDDEESRAALKMACDVIVLVLTGDESMDLLYDGGKGRVYRNMLSWLNSDDFDLLSTSILAIGNFARNDSHCVQMVQNGIAKTLLDLLSKHNSAENDAKVQHAILGALRNLVILPQNKARILREGLVDILYPMLDVKHSQVAFKLIGTLRIVIDGQETAALDLAMRRDLLERIVDWCSNSDHLGVRGEASRLLAWLVKHSHSSKPHRLMLSTEDCVKCLVEMVPSNHAVMQNEAFYALSLLCATCLQKDNENCLKSKHGSAESTKSDTKNKKLQTNRAECLRGKIVEAHLSNETNEEVNNETKEHLTNRMTGHSGNKTNEGVSNETNQVRQRKANGTSRITGSHLGKKTNEEINNDTRQVGKRGENSNIEIIPIDKTERNLSETLVEADIGSKINFLVSKYKDKLEPETVTNLLALLEQLVDSGPVLQHLKTSGVREALAVLSDRNEAQLERILQILDGAPA